MPKDAADIIARARMCGARVGDILTLDDGSRWKLGRGVLIPINP